MSDQPAEKPKQLAPQRVNEVVVAGTQHEAIMFFLASGIALEMDAGAWKSSGTLHPAGAVALPWAVAEGLRDALTTQLDARKQQLANATERERPN